jgi:hypothetical protein
LPRNNKKLTGSSDLNDVLNSLRTAKDAPFNAYQRQHDPTCLPDTRVDLLQEIYNWGDGRDGRCIFWLNGLAGTGKSTIARTVARRYLEQRRLGASFFFSRGGGDVGHAGKFVTSIAVQLANSIPSLDQQICKALTERRDITSESLRDQWQQLVLRPLSRLGENGCQSSYVLVVDALDECDNDNTIRIIIHLFAETRSSETVRLRVFLTSRPEVPIRNGFMQMPDAEHQDFILHNISPSIVDHDIQIFLRHELERIASEHCLGAGWPGEQSIEQLIHSANGLFIWAATACRFIGEGRSLAADRLSIVLKANSADDSADGFSSDDSATADNDDNPAVAPEQHLDKLYITVLRSSVHKYKKPQRKKWRELLGTTMGAIAVLFSLMSTQSLRQLLNTAQDQIDQTLNDLHAIVDIPKNSARPLRLHHPSFRDFLLDRKRSEDLHLGIEEKQVHRILATKCIQLMSKSLRQDICEIGRPGALVTEVDSELLEQHLAPEVQYACLYWIQHLQKSGSQLNDGDGVHQFLQEHLLQWLEALGWMRKVPEGVHNIVSLQSLASVSITPARKTSR